MALSWQLEVKMKVKNIFDSGKKILKVSMKYGSLVVFIRHGSAEIRGFRYGLTLAIGTLKIMASSGVFVRVVFALKHTIKNFPSTQSNICT
jgi:hypothetical protein